MKKFKWPLQRLLEIKKKKEKFEQAQLFSITEQLSQKRGEIMMQKMILKNMLIELKNEPVKTRMEKQQLFMRTSETNDKLIAKLVVEAAELEKIRTEKMAEVIKLKKFNEDLEKLRQEAKTEFITEQEKIEQKAADDATVFGFARKMVSL
ncbi:MAG: hypothetical protein K8R02_04640 [Anaerohalosphaeraceae bacterium]|nr:hypothetical protein [Anaerohalosphaeraceae bacterium]